MTDENDTSTPAKVEPAGAQESAGRLDRQVPLKKVLAVVGVLVVLGGTFYAGMAYENHRIVSGIEDAFSDFGDEDSDSQSASDDEEQEEPVPDPVELAVDQPFTTAASDEDGEAVGEITVTLIKVDVNSEGQDEDPKLTRTANLYFKVENSGDTSVSPSLPASNFEGEDGQVFSDTSAYCEDDELPYGDIEPGQFVEGCGAYYAPSGAGRLTFESDVEGAVPFFVSIKAS